MAAAATVKSSAFISHRGAAGRICSVVSRWIMRRLAIATLCPAKMAVAVNTTLTCREAKTKDEFQLATKNNCSGRAVVINNDSFKNTNCLMMKLLSIQFENFLHFNNRTKRRMTKYSP
jgi:hypothetical protein